MNKFLEIAKSWYTSFNPNEQQQKIAEERIATCNKCDSRKYNELANFYYCGECGCPLKSKTYSPVENSCPLNKWER